MELQREVCVIFMVLASSQKVKEHLLPVRKKRMLMTLVPGSSLVVLAMNSLLEGFLFSTNIWHGLMQTQQNGHIFI